jgi:hypothetical protein
MRIELSRVRFFKSTNVKRGRIDIWIGSAEWSGLESVVTKDHLADKRCLPSGNRTAFRSVPSYKRIEVKYAER